MTAPITAELVSSDDNNERRLALDFAVQFHRHAGSDDPVTVVETAHAFLTFLTGAAAATASV